MSGMQLDRYEDQMKMYGCQGCNWTGMKARCKDMEVRDAIVQV
jgi:hypothetical protein